MSSYDLLELNIPAKAEYVGVARLFVSGVANRMAFSYDDIEDLKVSVAEACTNAVKHAYEGKGGSIRLNCYSYQNRLDIVVVDNGKSFDIEQMQEKVGPIDKDQTVDQLNEGGLGLFLIDTLMDEVKIQDIDGIVIMMTKYKNKDGVAHNDRPSESTSTR